LKPVLERLGCETQILFVDDGSTDATRAAIRRLQASDPSVRLVGLSRNFGKEAALTAGIDRVDSDLVVPIDVDLQDPPALIPQMIERWRDGYDVVYAVRTDRSADTFGKRMTASSFYRLFNRISHERIPEDVGDFRLIDRRVVAALRQLPERNRFMKGLFAWVGFRAVGVPYARPGRETGSTGLSWLSLWRLAIDGITSFSTLPLRIWTYVGILTAILAFAYGAFIAARTLVMGVDLPGYASLMVIVLFLGGIQLISIGVIGEYLGRLFIEAKKRPIYLVDHED
jgi:glycosyltransferase involved in cell wall biosynthesis